MADMKSLDVREDLRSGTEPLPRILEFVRGLPPGDPWRLRATFEPIPLLRMMEGKGYSATATRLGESDWEVLFTPGNSPSRRREMPSTEPSSKVPEGLSVVSVDNRGLMPPEPMIRVLTSLDAMAEGELLEVMNDREPLFLYPELQNRGYRFHTESLADGIKIRIWKAAGRHD